MLFGDKAGFGIEAEFREVYGKWTYGRLRFWIKGSAIGDFDDTSDLATSARWGRTFLGASHLRTRVDLDHSAPSDVFELLYGQFVEPVNTASPKPWPGHWNGEPYLLDEVGESALRDKFAIVVVRRGDGSDRLLVSCFAEEDISEIIVPAGECDLVVDAYCSWVESLRTVDPPDRWI